MRSAYQALVQERADKLKGATATLDNPESTPEQIAEANATVDDVKNRINPRLAVMNEARELQRQAAAGLPAAHGITVHDRLEDDPSGGFRDIGEFAMAVIPACRKTGAIVDPRLLRLGATLDPMKETGTVGEGYEVPAEQRPGLWKAILGEENLLGFVNPEPTSSSVVEVIADETTPWGATGVQAYWTAEGNSITPSKIATKLKTVRLHKVAALVPVTDELATDAPRLRSRIELSAPAAISYKIDEAIVAGDGVKKPLGWRMGGGAVTVSKEGSQAADTIVAANILKMFAQAIDPTNSSWITNKNTLPQIQAMTIGNQPIWTPPNAGMREAPGGFLLGRPIRFSRHAETLGDLGDIMFVDPNGYYCALHSSGMKFQSSIHLYFDQDVEALRWTVRVGGMPLLSAPISVAKGDNESHIVLLQAR